jgi:hypothetical protein
VCAACRCVEGGRQPCRDGGQLVLQSVLLRNKYLDQCHPSAHLPLQSCYGIMELPGPDQMWMCSACEQEEEGKPGPQVGAVAGAGRQAGRQAVEVYVGYIRSVGTRPTLQDKHWTPLRARIPPSLAFLLSSILQCCVCPVAGGALKPTNMRGLWCHSACMQWIPEVGPCLPACRPA